MPLRNAQSGVILITGLILLFVIAIAAVTSMQISNLDYKMAANTAFKNQSFQASESGRIAAGDAINQFIYDRTWVGVTPHSGISYNSSFNPLDANAASENPFNATTLIKDMEFTIATSSGIEAVDADIYVIRSPSIAAASGGGLQQLSGYRGAGKGIASSGSAIYFELRATGTGFGNAQTVTASEYRTFIQ